MILFNSMVGIAKYKMTKLVNETTEPNQINKSNGKSNKKSLTQRLFNEQMEMNKIKRRVNVVCVCVRVEKKGNICNGCRPPLLSVCVSVCSIFI